MSIKNQMIAKNSNTGFTLVELLVSIAIIGILASILYASFDQARAQTRDKARMATLKETQLALEQYKAQYGRYPEGNCLATYASDSFVGPGPVSGSVAGLLACANVVERASYIKGLTPDLVSILPSDTMFEFENDRGYYYRSNGYSYKLMAYNVVETLTIDSYDDEFARCPEAGGSCPNAIDDVTARTYAVYSPGAEDW